MNEQDLLEVNIHRLIRAGFSKQPSPEQERILCQKLLPDKTAPGDIREFPWQAALAISALLLVLAGWLLYQVLGFSGLAAEPGLLIAGSLLLVNLALLPFAGLVIVIRRRNA